MSDMTGATDNLAAGNPDLELIERGGTTLTPEFVEAFKQMSAEDRNIWVENARRNAMTVEFGWAASFLEDAELGPILREATDQEWTEDRLRRRIEQTQWWKKRTTSQRSWDQRVQTDPGTTTQEISRRKEMLKDVASQFGGVLTDDQLAEMATESLRSDWDENEISRGVASELMKGTDRGELRLGITGRGVRALAAQFAVPLSDQAANEWAGKIASGQITQTDYENWAREQARSLYPSLAAQIDRGLNVATAVSPYAQLAAQTVGVNPADIDFADPKWNVALNFDDGKGRRMMTLFEWGEHLRKDERYGYDRTPGARDKAYRMVSDLGRMFGLSA
jgi:hypothetical protein